MNRPHPMRSGIVVAVLWIIGQLILWAVVLAVTMILCIVLVHLLAGIIEPTNWKPIPWE